MGALLQYLVTGLGVGCAYALTGSGLVAIYRVTGVVNFAQGGFAVIAALFVSSMLGLGLPHGAAELLAVVLAALAGLLVGLVAIAKPGTTAQSSLIVTLGVGLRAGGAGVRVGGGRPRACPGRPGTTAQSSLIVTLGVGLLAYGAEILVWGDQPRSFPGLPGSVDVLGARFQTHYLLIIGVTAVVLLGMELLFGRTDTGRALTAAAANPYAARIVGISVTRTGLLAFVIGGALGGLAGVLVTPVQQVTFDADVLLVVNGFSAAILGNLVRPWWTLLGGLLLGVTQALVAGYWSTSYQAEVALVFMLAVMVVQAGRRPVAT